MQQKTSMLLLITSTLLGPVAYSQVVKPGQFVGGLQVSAHTFPPTTDSGFSNQRVGHLTLSPHIGFGLRKNLTLGAYARFNHASNGKISWDKYNHNFTAGLYLRKHFEMGPKFYGFLQTDLSYNTVGYDYRKSILNTYGVTNWYSLNVSGGIGYRLNKHISFDLMFNNLLQYRIGKNQSFNSHAAGHLDFRGVTQGNGISLGVTLRF